MISPIGVGDASVQHHAFATDSGNFVFATYGVVASNISMHYIDTANAALRIGTGTWTITGSNTADYAPSAADVATAGAYKLYPVLTLSTGPKAFDAQILEILNLP